MSDELRGAEAEALRRRAELLLGEGRGTEALACLAELARRFGDSPDAAERNVALPALTDSLSVLLQAGRRDDASAVCDLAVPCFYADDPQERSVLAWVLRGKGECLAELGRRREAIDAYREVVRLLSDADGADDVLAWAEVSMDAGNLLIEETAIDEAVELFDAVIGRFGLVEDPVLRLRVASACDCKALALFRKGDSDGARAICGEIVSRFSDTGDEALRDRVAVALDRSAASLRDDARDEEALAKYAELLAWLAEPRNARQRRLSARGLTGRAEILVGEQQLDEAAVVAGAMVGRLASEADESVALWLANGIIMVASSLLDADDAETALPMFDAVIARAGGPGGEELRIRGQIAWRGKLMALDRLGRPDDASVAEDQMTAFSEQTLALLENLLLELRDPTSRTERLRAAHALAEKGSILAQFDRTREAIEAIKELVSRFGDDTDSAMQDVVNSARDWIDRLT